MNGNSKSLSNYSTASQTGGSIRVVVAVPVVVVVAAAAVVDHWSCCPAPKRPLLGQGFAQAMKLCKRHGIH